MTRCVNRFPIRPISQAQVLKIPAVNYGSSRTIFMKALFRYSGLFRKSVTSPPPENWQKQQETAFLERVVCSYFETPRRGDFNAAATLCK